MTITFACPSGHQLSAPEAMAGKAGKCPKCSVAFLIPTLEEVAAANAEPAVLPTMEAPTTAEGEKTTSSPPPTVSGGAPAGSTTPGTAGSGTGSGLGSAGATGPKPATATIGEGSGKGTNDASNVFVFLCPNGHRLNGPPSLKGKAGQCPHCGAKFQIPTDDEEPPVEAEMAASDIPPVMVSTSSKPATSSPSGSFSLVDFSPGAKPAQKTAPSKQGSAKNSSPDFSAVFGGSLEQTSSAKPAAKQAGPERVASLGYIVGRLWEQRSKDSDFEIYLQEGEIISPDFYAEELSNDKHGVFASHEGDGTYHLITIPWEHVRRISLQKQTTLPEAFT